MKTTKLVNLLLNRFETLPDSLKGGLSVDVPLSEVDVDLGSLCHQMYIDTYGPEVPDPNPAYLTYLPMVTSSGALRFRGSGPGSHKEARISESNRFGKAFCRWFLYTHLGITHFAHMDQIIGGVLDPGDGFKVVRVRKGDTPDYVCVENPSKVFLAEAKGTRAAISFENNAFIKWRDQFTTVVVRDSAGKDLSIKGYIVATRLVNEEDSTRIRSTVFVEDPRSPGESHGGQIEMPELGQMVICGHYAAILDHLRMPLLATALRSGVMLPIDMMVTVAVWELIVTPFKGRRFVGGYFAPLNDPLANCVALLFGGLSVPSLSSSTGLARLNLASAGHTFFGLDLAVFKALRLVTLHGRKAAADLRPMQLPTNGHDGKATLPEDVSLLRDGSMIAPLDYLRLVGSIDV